MQVGDLRIIAIIRCSQMDFDIVEHEIEPPQEPVIPMESSAHTTGFPSASKFNLKRSRWSRAKTQLAQPQPPTKPQLEAEKIHQENIDRIANMTQEEVTKEKEELLKELDPKLIQALLKRTEKRVTELSEKPETNWIGSVRTDKGLQDLTSLDAKDVDRALGIQEIPTEWQSTSDEKASLNRSSLKKVTFDDVATVNYEDLDENIQLPEDGWEDVEDLHEMVPNLVAPKDYQLIDEEQGNTTVHFPQPKQQDLDINDPDFYNKLHEKYFPNLPKETEKLSWMTTPMPKKIASSYELISDMRFDFNGDLVNLDQSGEIPTYKGLHHHSDNPHMAGYTLGELAHLARSVVPGQRSIAIQTLGRILHKLGKHKYQFLPVEDDGDNPIQQEMVSTFEEMVWQVIDELRIIDTLKEALQLPNLSVRNYAIEALWLWNEGGQNGKSNSDKMPV